MSAPAALPMYDFAALRPHTDALWAAIRPALAGIGLEVDKKLDRDTSPPALWADPSLGFAQTCGLPYVRGLRGKVTLIGTPDYGIIPQKPGWYNSAIIVRDDPRRQLADFAGAHFAYNETTSQSGLYALMYVLHRAFGDGLGFFGTCQMSGAHVLSVQAVLDGRADIAAIDALTWRYVQQIMPETNRLRVLAHTPPNPGLPYISRGGQSAAALAEAVETALKSLAPAQKLALGIKGLWRATPDDYNIVFKRAARSAPVVAAHKISGLF